MFTRVENGVTNLRRKNRKRQNFGFRNSPFNGNFQFLAAENELFGGGL